jgi:hypothetical protein
MGLPAINDNGLPGNRVDAYRAGMMPIAFVLDIVARFLFNSHQV